jgi:hypothetical protein
MYANLVKEMARSNLVNSDIAEFLKIHHASVKYKIHHETFSIAEAFKLQEEWFPDATLEYLFESVPKR